MVIGHGRKIIASNKFYLVRVCTRHDGAQQCFPQPPIRQLLLFYYEMIQSEHTYHK